VLPKLMQRLVRRERLRETEVVDVWSKFVGEFIALRAGGVAQRNSLRAGASASFALRTRASLQDRHLSRTKNSSAGTFVSELVEEIAPIIDSLSPTGPPISEHQLFHHSLINDLLIT